MTVDGVTGGTPGKGKVLGPIPGDRSPSAPPGGAAVQLAHSAPPRLVSAIGTAASKDSKTSTVSLTAGALPVPVRAMGSAHAALMAVPAGPPGPARSRSRLWQGWQIEGIREV